MKKTKNQKNKLLNVLIIITLIVGVGLLAYPTVSNYINELNQTKSVASYLKATKNLDEKESKKQLDLSIKYNESLLKKQNPFLMTNEEKKVYENLLDVTDTGIMAYVEIPKIDVLLPIYHGTDEGILQVAIGHLPGSSLPVGGPSTHSVISGHRGLPSARLFTDLDKMKYGDIFFINVLNKKHAYEVDKIEVINPDEVQNLKIEKGRDYCTLLTCTPYGVNTHRLTVRGHRIKLPKNSADNGLVKKKKTKMMLAISIIVVIVLLLIIILFKKIKTRRKL